MNRILKWLVRLVLAIAVVSVAGAAMAWYLISRSLPDYDGTIRLAGLDAPVTIIRDANAVPHIRADSDHDAFFALGLVHAQDRLWQMELGRRAAQGRLSALFGERTVPVDRLVKTLDLYGLASRSVAAQSEESRAALDAYAAGVNAWIRHVNANALGRGALEFFVFGAELSPWTPADSIGILKMMALRLSAAARNEVRRARALLTLPPERVADILPDYPVPAQIAPRRPNVTLPGASRAAVDAVGDGAGWDVTHLTRAEAPECPRSGQRAFAPKDADCASPKDDPLLMALGWPAPPELAGASNGWAVDGTRSATGQPLLANDPHLWLAAPSVWYLADVQGAALSAIGGTLPGVPAILIGHNGALGWGLTTANVDDQDLFVEQLNPENPDEYLLPDSSWAAFERRSIRIEIAGRATETAIVRRSRHGPILSGDQFGADAITPPGHVTALGWTALLEPDRSMTAGIELMFARSVEEALPGAADVLAPAQNVILADAGGVAMIVAGALPDRAPDSLSRGRVPSAGSKSANDWRGIRSTDLNPRVVRPGSGAVANANNRTTDAGYPAHVSFDWEQPYRIQRLDKELSVRAFHSVDGFVALQNDAISEMARSVLPLIARDLWWREGTTAIEDPRRRRALELLANWNGEMSQHGAQPLIFLEWMRALTRRLAADELGALFPDFAGPRPLFVERVFRDVDGAAVWCDVDKTPEQETCAQAAALALDDALARLGRDYGDNVERWRWGAEHLAVHRHTPFGHLGPLGLVFNIEHETAGGNYTLLRGQTRGIGQKPFRNVHAAGLRVVYDFSELNRSQMIIATGQSGHPFSRFYDHLAGLWARGEMIPMSTDDADARGGALGIMTLEPLGAE